jgi:hypothetical protein
VLERNVFSRHTRTRLHYIFDFADVEDVVLSASVDQPNRVPNAFAIHLFSRSNANKGS